MKAYFKYVYVNDKLYGVERYLCSFTGKYRYSVNVETSKRIRYGHGNVVRRLNPDGPAARKAIKEAEETEK